MTHKIISDVETEPVSLDDARLQISAYEDDTYNDALILTWIPSGREMAEQISGWALAQRTLEMVLDAFPRETYIDLDMPPVTSITSIKYTDEAGVEQTLDPSKYSLSLYGESRRVNLAYGETWPTTRSIADAVRIRYVCGHTPETVAKCAKSAILLMVSHWYEHRDEVDFDTLKEIPLSSRALLNTIRRYSR